MRIFVDGGTVVVEKDDGYWYTLIADDPEYHWSAAIPCPDDHLLAGMTEFIPVPALQQIRDHHADWQKTLERTPQGWTTSTCAAYRMAMRWVIDALDGES
jgi:hypothetical protein